MTSQPAIYVVNMKRRADRRRNMEVRLSGFQDIRFTSNWDIEFDGATGHQLLASHPRVVLFDWEDPDSNNEWYSRPLKWGEVGCAIAHIACWEDFLGTDALYAVVLEDDVVPVSGFDSALIASIDSASSEGFDLLYLGRVPQGPDRGTRGAFRVPGYSHCTYGYVITRPGAEKLVQMEPWRGLIPIDEFLPASFHPHPRADVRQRFPPALLALSCTSYLVHQEAKLTMGSDTEASEFV